MSLISLFCAHSYVSLSKKEYNWSEQVLDKDTTHYLYPKYNLVQVSSTTEVLLCEKCGKIKKIKY